MQWFSTNIYTSCILNYPFLSELKLYTAETYLPRINFIILTRVWLKIYVSIFLWVVKTSQDFHRTDRTESLPPYPILICTTFGISAENFMLLSTDARFLQFQQLMECTSRPTQHQSETADANTIGSVGQQFGQVLTRQLLTGRSIVIILSCLRCAIR